MNDHPMSGQRWRRMTPAARLAATADEVLPPAVRKSCELLLRLQPPLECDESLRECSKRFQEFVIGKTCYLNDVIDWLYEQPTHASLILAHVALKRMHDYPQTHDRMPDTPVLILIHAILEWIRAIAALLDG